MAAGRLRVQRLLRVILRHAVWQWNGTRSRRAEPIAQACRFRISLPSPIRSATLPAGHLRALIGRASATPTPEGNWLANSTPPSAIGVVTVSREEPKGAGASSIDARKGDLYADNATMPGSRHHWLQLPQFRGNPHQGCFPPTLRGRGISLWLDRAVKQRSTW